VSKSSFAALGEPHDAFGPDRMPGYHFAKDPAVANSFTMERYSQAEHGAKEGGHVIPVRIPSEDQFLEVPQPQYDYARKEGQPVTNRNIETGIGPAAVELGKEALPTLSR
jgi:hypothetical protein